MVSLKLALVISPTFNADISQWNVSQATNMYAMFWSARSFNQPIGSWDISNVKNMVHVCFR